MTRKTFFFIPVLLLASVQMRAQCAADPYSDDFRNWVRTIGSDEFGGRKPMTPFETKTIDYIAGEFHALGLQPAFDGSYFQKVKELSTTVSFPEKGIPVRTPKGTIRLSCPEDIVVWTTKGLDKQVYNKTEYVFCGFGINAPEYDWNDYEGIDVKGKIVIAMVNDPGFYDETLFRGRNMTYYGRWRCKMEYAQSLGAEGCLIIHNEAAASYGWHVCYNGRLGSNITLFDEQTGNLDELAMRGWLNENACRRLFEMAGVDFDEAIASAKKPGFKPIPLGISSSFKMDVKCQTGESYNVAGVLPGTDLKDECVAFSAHWDHFGTDAPDGNGDPIYNGAADNGSGIAGIMMIAKKLQSMPTPRRSILFLSSTSEESGLLGSRYYCSNPAFPMEKTVACFNFDCIAPSPLTRDVRISVNVNPYLQNLISAAAVAQGRHVVVNRDNRDGRFFRSDHWNFVMKGVPAAVLQDGVELVNPDRPNKYPRPTWYHKPNDEYREDWDIEGAIANVNLLFSVALSVANRQ